MTYRQAGTGQTIDKAQAHFDYAPRIPLDEGVAETIEWYKAKGWL